MAQGLQCFDGSGRKIFDTDERSFKYLGQAYVTSNSYTITDSRIGQYGGVPVIFCTSFELVGTNMTIYAEAVISYSYSGNTITITMSSKYGSLNANFLYGVI